MLDDRKIPLHSRFVDKIVYAPYALQVRSFRIPYVIRLQALQLTHIGSRLYLLAHGLAVVLLFKLEYLIAGYEI